MAEIYICNERDLADGAVLIFRMPNNDEIGIYCHAGEYFAYQNRCLHQGGPVCEGEIIPKVEDVITEDKSWCGYRFNIDEPHIVCPWHGYEFKLKSGECAADPRLRLKSFKVIVQNKKIYVSL